MLKARIENGTRFGRLVVLGPAPTMIVGIKCTCHKRSSRCRCDCGKEVIVADSQLRSGKTQSCGCYRYDQLRKSNTTHNESKTKLYDVWLHVIDRCTNPKCKDYARYGGRGITVCSDWLESYEKFAKWAKENGYKPGLSIDRIDNNLGYCPENCKFASMKEQSNNRSSNHQIIWNGETHSMQEWSEITGIHYSRIRYRASHGWPVDQIFCKEVFSSATARKRFLKTVSHEHTIGLVQG